MLDVGDVVELLAIRLLGIIPEDDGIMVSVNRGIPIVFDDRAQRGLPFETLFAGIPILGLRKRR